MRRLIPWIGVGLVLRLVLMATVIHPDIRGHNLAAYLISQRGQLLTFYDYISQLPRDNRLVQIYGDGLFIYPPLAYWTHAVFMAVLSPVYPWGDFERLIYNFRPVDGLLLVLLKFPYLAADGLGLWLILKAVEKRQQFLVGMLWIFNPVTIYASYMLAQFDIYIAVLILAAIFLAGQGRSGWSAVMLGLAAGFKPFPLLLAPFLGRGWKDKIQLVGISLGAYGLMILPYLSSVGFKHYALLANQADKLWFAKIMVSPGQYLPLFLVGLVGLWWWNYFAPKALPVWGWWMTVLLSFYSLTHYHPQWFVWVAPLLLLALVSRPSVRLPVAVLVASFVVIVLSFEPSLNFGLVGLPSSLQPWLTDQIVSLVRGIFAATAVVVVWQVRHGADQA